MICPKCGEVNSDNFRFCGMCGTLLEARVEARRPAGAPVPNLPKIANSSGPAISPVVESATNAVNKHVPSISGPSMLGLDHPGPSQPGLNQRALDQPRNQPSPNHDNIDALREKSFSGLDSFFEPEEPKTGGRRILLLVVLLAALGAAGWWTYTNYLGTADSRRPEGATASTGEAADAKPPEKQAASAEPEPKTAAPAPDAGSQQATPPATVPVSPPDNANASASPEPAEKTADTTAKPEVKPLTPRIALGDKSAAKRVSRASIAKPSRLPEPAAGDSGDADFRKGEAYLYGRGAHENCDEAVKYLKAASAKSNAKARSAFGTMYATGHCVARDLPTSYLWFAMALRVDPNNQILEKDLSAIWNQMTPPERQLATRMKQ
ncbi:MAG: zinc-ribbon domain-containing protein [Terriglobales bacterium]